MGLGFASSITPALADADDAAWIKKCVSDNKREGATPEVVAAWCSCMNNKMSSEETLSITAWEKSHPAEVAAGDRDPGGKETRWGKAAGGLPPSQIRFGASRSQLENSRQPSQEC